MYRVKAHLLQHPLVTAASVAEAVGVSEVAAQTSIDKLAAAGVLTRAAGGARYRVWQATEVLAALDAFAARARRARW